MNNINRTFGYARISDSSQNESRQIAALIEAGVEERFIFLDKQSGKDFNRPNYLILKNGLREGDLLIVKSIDRFGRNYKEIISEWQDITQRIKADIKVLDMNLLDTTLHKDLLGTFISDLILQVLAYVSEQERQYIKTRQSEGIAIAKSVGKKFGRPKIEKPEKFNEVYAAWTNKEITAKKAMDILGLKKSTFYELVRNEESIVECIELPEKPRIRKSK